MTTYGVCKLCGQNTKLTFEHVPPQKAFNTSRVKEHPLHELLKTLPSKDNDPPLSFENLSFRINQRGQGGMYLCSSCNNNTGNWYVSEYVKFINKLHEIIYHNNPQHGDLLSVELSQLYPLRIFKAIMTMFCDINHFEDDNLKNYLLTPESITFDSSKYSLYIHLAPEGISRQFELSAAILNNRSIVLLSEIIHYPIGLTLYVNLPPDFTPPGICINAFSTRPYDDLCNITIDPLPVLSANNFLPGNYASRPNI